MERKKTKKKTRKTMRKKTNEQTKKRGRDEQGRGSILILLSYIEIWKVNLIYAPHKLYTAFWQSIRHQCFLDSCTVYFDVFFLIDCFHFDRRYRFGAPTKVLWWLVFDVIHFIIRRTTIFLYTQIKEKPSLVRILSFSPFFFSL